MLKRACRLGAVCAVVIGGLVQLGALRPARASTTGGCVAAVVQRFSAPVWTRPARVPAGTPFVVARGARVAGFLFEKLHVDPTGKSPRNKILWVVGRPRGLHAFHISARHASPRATIQLTVPATSGPGTIYPSVINFTHAGCWTLELRWSGVRASVGLHVARGSA